MPAPYLYLAAAIALEVIGTSFLKLTDGFRNWLPTTVVAISYAGTFYFMSLAIKTMPVGIVYAIWSGVGIVLIALIGWIAFKQALDLAAICGMALIVAGVIVINTFSRSVSH
ncbi:MAG: multidrug efflux SMR transporter [Hyphomonadaceae bacterium]|nr:multidrug efflux SMR transporter [Hyphomonadaceae bacterium]